MLEGIIIVNKPQDWTSFDVVAKIRNLTKVKKVGHSGTLDPMATGVLPIFLGKATKSIKYFMEGDKGYAAEMTLGVKTDSGDATGKPVMTNDKLKMTNEGIIIETFKKYIGEIEQLPPMFSAKKVNGQRLYKLARKGIEIKREPKKVKIYSLTILEFCKPENPGNRDVQSQVSKVKFQVTCSKGTYIRQLAVDIGDDLGCGAHLSKLTRTYAHPFHIAQALNMDTIITLAKHGKIKDVIIPVGDILDRKSSAGL